MSADIPLGEVPFSLEAERAILGAILLEPAILPRAIELLTGEEFSKEGHRIIYGAMLALAERGEPLDVITVSEKLRRAGHVEEVGGQAALATLMEEATVATQFVGYCAIIRDLARKRSLARLGHELSVWALNGRPSGEVLDLLRAQLEELPGDPHTMDGPTVVRGAEILASPATAVPWVVEHVFAQGTQGMIVGASHTAKSWVLFDLAVALAHESVSSWLGQRMVQHGPVCLESWEQGQGEDLRRIQKDLRGHGLSTCADGLILISDAPASLSDEAYWQRRRRELREWGAIAYLVDSLSEAVGPGVELNDNAAYSAWWHRRIKPLLADGLLVVFTHLRGHRKPGVPASDRDSASRGATQIRALSSAVLELRDAGDDRFVLKHNKHRLGPAVPFGHLALAGGPDEPSVNLVLTPLADRRAGAPPEDLEAVANLANHGRPYRDLRNDLREVLGVSDATAKRRIAAALDGGLVVKDGDLYRAVGRDHGIKQDQMPADTTSKLL